MTDPRKTETETEAAPPELIAEPGGRAKVWMWVVVGLALLAAVFIVRRPQEEDLTPVVVAAPAELPANGAIDAPAPEPR